MSRAAQQLVEWIDELGQISDEPGRLTRTFLSPAMRRANTRVGEWMRDAGFVVREDAVGNLIGRLEGTGGSTKTLLLGSHLDTVRDAGRFDGALGVLLPIQAVDAVRRRRGTLPFAVEVVGFSEEEGVRFGRAYLGSRGFTGTLRRADVAQKDLDGVSVRHVLEAFNGRRFTRPKAAHRRSDLVGYLEVHIEQGPILQERDLAVGIVSGIAGQTRGRVTFRGQAGHAGTTPMSLRRDALAGAAEWIVEVEATARARAPLVATVGTIAVKPGAPNVIPGEAVVSVDLRHPEDAPRRQALQRVLAAARTIARRRKLRCTWELTQEGGAMRCSAALSAVLAESVRAVQGACPALVSGAGHDAAIVAEHAPTAMLFVRCRDGVSHHPAEHASRADISIAVRVVEDFLERLASASVGQPANGANGTARSGRAIRSKR